MESNVLETGRPPIEANANWGTFARVPFLHEKNRIKAQIRRRLCLINLTVGKTKKLYENFSGF
jgi:hypothetical protein